jgi:hypothetical protein
MQSRIGNLQNYKRYIEDQLDPQKFGSLMAQFRLWEGQRLFDEAAFEQIDAHYLNNSSVYWWTAGGIANGACSGQPKYGHVDVYAIIAKAGDGTYSVSKQDHPWVQDTVCPTPPDHEHDHGRGREVSAQITTFLQDRIQPISIPTPPPVNTDIQVPGISHGAAWGEVVQQWNTELQRLPLIQANANALKGAVLAAETGNAQVIDLLNKLSH